MRSYQQIYTPNEVRRGTSKRESIVAQVWRDTLQNLQIGEELVLGSSLREVATGVAWSEENKVVFGFEVLCSITKLIYALAGPVLEVVTALGVPRYVVGVAIVIIRPFIVTTVTVSIVT